MSFHSPLFLLGLMAVPLALGLHWLAQRRRKRYVVRFPGVPALSALTGATPAWRRHLPAALFAFALTALALAVARPEATVAVPIEQASVVLVTDVSRSMRANDVAPSRIEAAKQAARTFLKRLPGKVNIGVVAFSNSPHTVQRPTTDRTEIEALIDGLAADGATATGDALATATALFGERKGRRPPAALVLLSDGKTTTGRDPVEVAREAGRLRIPIYTVALGTAAGVLQGAGPYGADLSVPPDPATLKAIAKASGGRAFTAKDAKELHTVYDRLGSEIGTKREKREVTAGFAAGGLLLLITASVASIRTFGRLP